MTPSTKLVLLVLPLALLAGCGDDNHWQDRQFDRANNACQSSTPKDIQPKGQSWSYGAYVKVTCKDGSVRVVR